VLSTVLHGGDPTKSGVIESGIGTVLLGGFIETETKKVNLTNDTEGRTMGGGTARR
jgi:hypothetical protein